MGKAERIAGFSIAVGIVVLGLKAAAWWLTGSAALFSDALESTVNIAASMVAMAALHLAAKPADANHPYGHDKAEFFAAVVEGVLIVVAALSIFRHAWDVWQHPVALDAPWRGLALNGAATMVNALWGFYLLRRGRVLRSPALAADARHLMTDVVTSLAVMAGVTLTVWTGETAIDPILAALVGVHVLISGAAMIRQSVGGLMDTAPEPVVLDRIRALVAEHASGAIEAHDLRTRHAGRLTFLDFHLVVPGAMTVADSHAICDRIEAGLKAELEQLVITIHVEPEIKAKRTGVPVL